MVVTVGGCDAILCPIGFFSPTGRQVSMDEPCQRCDSVLAKPFLGQTRCDEFSERNVLIELFEQTNGESWKMFDLWASNEPICSWYGVECKGDNLNDHGVSALKLAANNLAGTFPEETLLLPSLVEIDLSGNPALRVSFKDVTEPAPLVETLTLTNVSISSLAGISRTPNLRHLAVSGISGEFISALFEPKVAQQPLPCRKINIRENPFYAPGEFPSELFSLSSSLELLDLSNGFLVGTLPSKIGLLTNLKRLDATSNDFHGSLPSEIGLLSMLEELILTDNLLSGALPSEGLSSLTRLKHLSISRKAKSGRKMSGPLPSWESSLPAMETLSIDGNDFSGYIPADFLFGSHLLESVNVTGNRLTGAVPLELPLEVKSDSATDVLSSQPQPDADEREILTELFNSCGGKKWIRREYWGSRVDICSWHGVGCSNDGHIMMLNLQSNNLVGGIPEQIFNLTRLELLWLGGNPSIDIPLENVEFSSILRDLRLDNTTLASLRGIERATSLTSLDVSNNELIGTFPSELFKLQNLRKLMLSNNTLEGNFPSSLASLPYLRVLEAEHNHFSGALPSLHDSVPLRSVSLGYNEFQGSIPHNFLENVPRFAGPKVFLQGNRLTGALPLEWKRFENMTLDIHENRIDEIPSVLCEHGAGWNGGVVGKYGCGALACPPGTANRHGRQSPDYPVCVACPAAERYFGQTDCDGDNFSDNTVFKVCMSLLLLLLLLMVALMALSNRRKRELRYSTNLYSS